MGKFNKKFDEYSKDNYISAEELQELAKGYSRITQSARPGADNNYTEEYRLSDEKEFWKKFKKRYKKAGSEKLGVAGVAGRADREKLIAAYNNPQYGPPVKEETKEKEEDYTPEVRDYNLDFSSQEWKMEEQDNLKEYDTGSIQKEINSIQRESKDPGTFKSYLDALRGKVKKPDKMMVNKELKRDIKRNKKEIKKASSFNPDPIKMTSFKDAKVDPNQPTRRQEKASEKEYKKVFKQNSDKDFELKSKKSLVGLKPTSSGAFDSGIKALKKQNKESRKQNKEYKKVFKQDSDSAFKPRSNKSLVSINSPSKNRIQKKIRKS